jgi:hypothetical protein
LRKTVVKHEAFAVAKASGRAVPADAALELQTDERAWTDERAERYERLRVGAEAMAGLKPQEIRCLLLKAEGVSYQEICGRRGFPRRRRSAAKRLPLVVRSGAPLATS